MKDLALENVSLIFKNFSGRSDGYDAGRRTFCVLIDAETAAALNDEGWTVKTLQSRDEDEPEKYFIKVRVRYDNFPPKIYMVTSKKKTLLTEDTIDLLDNAEITNVDIIINPYQWSTNGKSGISAYVKTMYVTIAEDAFAYKYDMDEEIPFN